MYLREKRIIETTTFEKESIYWIIATAHIRREQPHIRGAVVHIVSKYLNHFFSQ